jgi:hypothetical protein
MSFLDFAGEIVTANEVTLASNSFVIPKGKLNPLKKVCEKLIKSGETSSAIISGGLSV